MSVLLIIPSTPPLHDAAFRYFSGCPEECVYDQTKLVVLHEQYRELQLNQGFAAAASHGERSEGW